MLRVPVLRVHVVCAEVPPDVVGGLGRYAERMMAALRDLGTPVEVYGAVGRHGATRTERIGDVTLHRIRLAFGDAGAGRLARMAGMLVFNARVATRILRSGRSGAVVAVHDWMGCVAGILCRVLGRVPVVFHVHTREPGPAGRAIALLEAAQARLARLIVVPSERMREALVASGWPPGRLRVIPHGFEDPELVRLAALPGDEREEQRAEIRRRYLPGGEGRLVVFAGRLSPHKGVQTLIRATRHLVREHPDARVVLIGEQAPRTTDNAVVSGLIDRLGLDRYVIAEYRFVAPAEVFAHFLAADVCAFPSTYEPFGLVAVEAMALGRPVVLGPGYSPEVAGDGAIRFADDSPEELAAALSRCLSDPEAALELARRGSRHVRERYSWERTAKLTLAAYAEAAR